MPTSYLDLFQDKGYGKAVEKIIEEDRKLKVVPHERDREQEQLKINILDELAKDFFDLRTYAGRLYGYDSAFKKLSFSSQDPRILTGSANPNAARGNFKVDVLRLARKHRLASDPIDVSQSYPPAEFTLQVGEKNLRFKFKGGTIRDFAKLFQYPSKKKYLDASVIKQDEKNATLVLGSKEEGTEGRIRLMEDESGLLMKLGLFKIKAADHVSIFSKKESSIQSEKNAFIDGVLTLIPKTKEKMLLNIPVESEKEMLALEVAWQSISDEELKKTKPGVTPHHLNLPVNATISLDGHYLISSLLIPFDRSKRSDEQSVEAPQKEINPSILKLTWNIKGELETVSQRLPDSFAQKDGERRLEIHPPKDAILSLAEFLNENSHHVLRFKTFEKVSQTPGDKTSKKDLEKAQDAELEYKGVKVRRPSNQVDDLIEGVSLNLKGVGEAKFSIEKDEKFMEEQLINFIGQFNICMGKLNELMTTEPPPVDVEEEKKKRYGLFRNAMSFRFLRDKMTSIVTKAHPTSDEQVLSLLVQLGITSTFIRGNPYHPDAKKLDYQEDKYKAFYDQHPKLVAELFGYNSDGDLIIDSGVAYEMVELARGYTQPGNPFELSKQTARTRIKNLEQVIKRKEQQLEDHRIKLIKEFSELDSAQKQMEKARQMMESFEQK